MTCRSVSEIKFSLIRHHNFRIATQKIPRGPPVGNPTVILFKKTEWVSELGTCVMCPNVLRDMCEFCVLNKDYLLTDHVPIYLVLLL